MLADTEMLAKNRYVLQISLRNISLSGKGKQCMASVKTKDLAKTVLKPPKKKASAQPPVAPNKLVLLVTVVNRKKSEFYVDLLQSFEVNLQLDVTALGTCPDELRYITTDPEKQVIFTVIRQDKVRAALDTLEEKFATIRGGKGVAFTVPLTSTIGVSVYQFLTNIL